MNDIDLKKQRNLERRQAEKAKLHQIIGNMSQEEIKKFIIERKQKRAQQKQKVKNAMDTGQVMIVDLVFEEKMNGKENKSLAKQI